MEQVTVVVNFDFPIHMNGQADCHMYLHHIGRTGRACCVKPELLKGVYDMGFNAPSNIQETVLLTLLADPPQNMIAQS